MSLRGVEALCVLLAGLCFGAMGGMLLEMHLQNESRADKRPVRYEAVLGYACECRAP